MFHEFQSYDNYEIEYLYPMPRLAKRSIVDSINNGDEQVLLYISRKYYPSARKWLRRNGCRDIDTPAIFSRVVLKVYRDLRHSPISSNINFEQYFFNSLVEYFNQNKPHKNINDLLFTAADSEIIGACYSILDESSRKILAARYVEKLSFEQIAEKYDYSNPVIAEFELNKAFSQFEKIAMARMNIN